MEETGLEIGVGALLYVSESYDGATQFTNATFGVMGDGEPHIPVDDAHAVAFEWVDKEQLAQKIAVRVVREPLVGYLAGNTRRYYGYAEAGISIEFAD